MSINATNLHALIEAFGSETSDWFNCEVELFLDDFEYQGRPQPGVHVKPIDRRGDGEEQPKPVPPPPKRYDPDQITSGPQRITTKSPARANDLDDEIPL